MGAEVHRSAGGISYRPVIGDSAKRTPLGEWQHIKHRAIQTPHLQNQSSHGGKQSPHRMMYIWLIYFSTFDSNPAIQSKAFGGFTSLALA